MLTDGPQDQVIHNNHFGELSPEKLEEILQATFIE